MREGRVAVERVLGKAQGLLCAGSHQPCYEAAWDSEAETPARDGRNFEQLKAKHWDFPTQNNRLKQLCEEKSHIGLLAGKAKRKTDFPFFKGGLFWGTF